MSAAVRDEEPGDIPLIRKVVTAALEGGAGGSGGGGGTITLNLGRIQSQPD